jgi:hypothetical protein
MSCGWRRAFRFSIGNREMGLSEDPRASAICPATGKDRLTRGEAKSLAKRWHPRDGGNVSAYKCRACKGWHVGNKRR